MLASIVVLKPSGEMIASRSTSGAVGSSTKLRARRRNAPLGYAPAETTRRDRLEDLCEASDGSPRSYHGRAEAGTRRRVAAAAS